MGANFYINITSKGIKQTTICITWYTHSDNPYSSAKKGLISEDGYFGYIYFKNS